MGVRVHQETIQQSKNEKKIVAGTGDATRSELRTRVNVWLMIEWRHWAWPFLTSNSSVVQ